MSYSAFRLDLLYRLRWNVFGDLQDVEVEDGLDSNGVEQRSPLSSHAIAHEPFADPPVHTLHISSLDVNDAVCFLFESKSSSHRYTTAAKPSEDPVTIWDFVKEAHNFLNQHEDLIRKFRTPLTRTGTKDGKAIDNIVAVETSTEIETTGNPEFFFNHAFLKSTNNAASVSIRTFAVGEMGSSLEKFCHLQRRAAQNALADRLQKAASTRISPLQPPDRIRQHLLLRLRWEISQSLDAIQVETGLDEHAIERRQLFSSSDIATQSLAEPPLCRATILFMDVLDAQQFSFTHRKYPYEPVVLENPDGRPLTIGDFVRAAHGHLQEHVAIVGQYKKSTGLAGRGVEDEPRLFVRKVASYAVGDEVAITVNVFADGEGGTSEKVFWEQARGMADKAREERGV